MKLTHPAQLDALPSGALVMLGGGHDWEATLASDPIAKWSIEHRFEVYLLTATARTAQDMERLLPGAIALAGDGAALQLGKDLLGGDPYWWGGGELAPYLPAEILFPGLPGGVES